jgi:hypothetical protein
MYIPEVKLWVFTEVDNELAWGAAKVINIGDKIISVDTIKIRSFEIPFEQWYPDTTIDKQTFQQSLNFTGWSGINGFIKNSLNVCNGETLQIKTYEGGDICANVATGPVILEPSQASVIYFKLTNGTIRSVDSGLSVSVNIFSDKAGATTSVIVEGKN